MKMKLLNLQKIDLTLLVLVIVSYTVFIALNYFFNINIVLWPMSQPFADLITITNTVDCPGGFENPYISGDCDPWGRMYNYPRIWLSVFSFLHLGKSSTLLLGFLYILLFAVSASKTEVNQNIFQRIFFFLLLLSPPVLLLLDRGNNDLLVFSCIILTYRGIKLNPDFSEKTRLYVPYFIFLILGFFKVYPFILITTVLVERITLNRKLVISTSFTLLACLYLLLIRDDLKLIIQNTPAPNDMAYGRMVKSWIINSDIETRIQYSLISSLSVLILSLITCLIFKKYFFKHFNQTDELKLWLFICGSGMYIGTFMIGNNYIYRIVFIMLCLPLLFDLFKNKPVKPIIVTILSVLFLRFHFNYFEHLLPFKQQFISDILLSWGIFFCLSTLTMFYTLSRLNILKNR